LIGIMKKNSQPKLSECTLRILIMKNADEILDALDDPHLTYKKLFDNNPPSDFLLKKTNYSLTQYDNYDELPNFLLDHVEMISKMAFRSNISMIGVSRKRAVDQISLYKVYFSDGIGKMVNELYTFQRIDVHPGHYGSRCIV